MPDLSSPVGDQENTDQAQNRKGIKEKSDEIDGDSNADQEAGSPQDPAEYFQTCCENKGQHSQKKNKKNDCNNECDHRVPLLRSPFIRIRKVIHILNGTREYRYTL